MTRRSAIWAGFGIPLGVMTLPAGAFEKEFWNDRKPEDWTNTEVKELLTKSPWAKEASIDDKGQVGTLGGPRTGGGRRARSQGGTSSSSSSGNPPKITWKAIVRWESALPVREALKGLAPTDVKDFYILNVVGNLPNALPARNEDSARSEEDAAYLKEVTTLQHKGDEVHLSRVELEAGNDVSPAGTLFYFSRVLDLMLEDKEATFTTKIGPLDVKCKFTLKDMLYHGKLEL